MNRSLFWLRIMRNRIPIWILSLLFFSEAMAKDLSLPEALRRAMNDNKEIKAARASETSAEQSLQGAYGKYFPQLDLIGSYVHLDEDIKVQGHIVPLPPLSVLVQKQDFSFASLLLSQPLFTGGKITANRDAKKELVASSKTDSKEIKARVLSDVVQQYFQVQLAEEATRVRSDAVKAYGEHLKNSESLLKQGQISKVQRMKIEVAASEAQREYLKARRDETLAREVLANTLELEDTDYTLTTKMDIPSLPELGDIKKKASVDNTTLMGIQHKRSLLDAKRKAVRAEMMPTLAITGFYDVYEDGLADFVPQWFVGVVLKMNIFNGLSDKRELDSLSQNRIALEAMETHASNMVSIGVQKGYSDILSSKEQYDSNLKTRDLAAEVRRLMAASFKNGFARGTDVIDAEVALTASQLNLSKSLYDYNNGYVQLLRLAGQPEQIETVYGKGK